MRTKSLFGILLMAFLVMTGLTACGDDNDTDKPHFVENARVQEEGQILSPGESVHLEGEGYLDSDRVGLNFYWDTGDPSFPEGYLKAYEAKILTCTSDGITIRMPYKKPESRVEIMLMRGGEMMPIGKVRLKDGTTPKEVKLYGINNNLHNKGSWTDNIRITRCYDGNADYETTSWAMDEHPDFHSAVGLWRSYGLCGLAQSEDVQRPFFFDFQTSEWKELSRLKTIALFSTLSTIGALQTTDGVNYSVNDISGDLDIGEDYATAKSSTIPARDFSFPAGLKAEQLGEYPGVYMGGKVFLSANKGDGKWAPVILDIYQGLFVLDDIDADGLIPFSFSVKVEGEGEELRRIAGYAVAREGVANGTELHLFDNNGAFQDEPFAVFPNRAVSISANEGKPGVLTVHFMANRAGNVSYDYSWDTKEWTSIHSLLGTFDEIVWAN